MIASFPRKVIDAEDRVFRKHLLRDLVELPRGGEVASERLLDNDARMLGQFAAPSPLITVSKSEGGMAR
jgi:hypothetical protein